MKIGMLTIATNNYMDFINPLYASSDQYFCKNHEVTHFLFTNHKELKIDSRLRKIVILQVNHLPWPNMTLKRYHIFSHFASYLSDMDYLYYTDADMKFVDVVGDEILSDRVVTLHPGFYNKPRATFPYENKRTSTACVPSNKGKQYYAGGFNGGTKLEFLKMSNHIKNNIDKDLENRIIARWHDESHLNHYYSAVILPTLVLSPSYCYPESKFPIPLPKKLLALDKVHKDFQK